MSSSLQQIRVAQNVGQTRQCRHIRAQTARRSRTQQPETTSGRSQSANARQNVGQRAAGAAAAATSVEETSERVQVHVGQSADAGF